MAAEKEIEVELDLDKMEFSIPPKTKEQTWKDWVAELNKEVGMKVIPEPEHEPDEDKEIGKLHEILYQACLKYITAWKECKKCMIELNHHNPIVYDPEEDKRYLEHMPALGIAENAFLQAYEELQDEMKHASEVFDDEVVFVQGLVDAHRKHAEELLK